MDDTSEEYLVSTIKVEEEKLERNVQESIENVNQTGFVAGPSASIMAEVPSSSVSLSAILEHLTSVTLKASSSYCANSSTVEQETKPLPASCPNTRDEIPPATKPGRDMTDPEYRDFVVSSFTTLIGLTNKLCGILERSVNSISQVLPASQVGEATTANQVNPASQLNVTSQVIPTSQVAPTSQDNLASQVDAASRVTEVNSQVQTPSQVNLASQVQPEDVDKTVNAEIPSDPLAIDEENDDVSIGTSGDDEEEMEESSSQSERQTRQSVSLKKRQRAAVAVTNLSDDNDDVTENEERHAGSSTSQPAPKKRKVQKQPNTSAFSGRVCSYKIGNTNNHVDPEKFLSSNIDEIIEILDEELIQKRCIKVVLLFECKMKKVVENKDSILSIYKTGPISMYRNSDIPSLLHDMFKEIMCEFTEKFPKGSGWNLEKICELVVRIAKFSPLKGGTFIKTPAFIANKRCIVNVKNKDLRCFEYCILAPFVNSKKRAYVQRYRICHDVNFKDLPMPMPVDCITKFEQMNPTYSVNVFVLEGEIVHPIRVAESEKENHRDLLLLHSADWRKYHYCYITNFSRLIAKQFNKTKSTMLMCKKCFTPFYRRSNVLLEDHKPLCNANIHTVIKLSKQKNNKTECKFRSHTKSYRAPFVVYADVLSHDENPDSNHENSTKNDIGKPVPLSVACYVHTHLGKKHCGKVPVGYKLFQGKDCVKQFVSHVENITENYSKIYKSPKDMDPMSREKEIELLKQTVCHICHKEFQKYDGISTDYDHITGEIRGRSHAICNLNFKLPTHVPVFFHRLETHVLHNLILELADGNSEVIINAHNSETYISFQKKIGNIYMRFLDTFNFMGENLDNLVKILPADGFQITEKEFQGHDVSLLKENHISCNEFIKNVDNIKEKLLLPVPDLGNMLSISQNDYGHACKVWSEFKIRNLGEFCNHHLKTRVTFLADVFENFRNICSTTFNLDPCNYQTMQDVTFDSAMKISQVELELLTDYNILSMIEAGIRGDFVQAVTRYAKANNDDCVDFDRGKPTSNLAYFRANYIHASQMLEPLPIGDFKFENKKKYNTEHIMNIPDDGKFGYIFEVSLEYPQSLHDPHSDHPYCQVLQSPPGKKVKILLGTLEDKENYVLHFRALKQALQSGLVLKKVHRVLKFKQSKWLKPCIEQITQLLRDAPNEFSKRFFDWALNSIHGKFLEDVRDTKIFTVVQTDDQLQKKVNKYRFLDFHIYSENCVAVIQDQARVVLDQPVYVGMVLMDLVKMQMNHFFYDVMKKQFGHRVRNCYEDSDLFVLSIESEDIDAELFKIRQHFDFSNYPVDHMLHSESNKEKLGTFKNMTVSNPILEFVGIGPKYFALKHHEKIDTSMEDSWAQRREF